MFLRDSQESISTTTEEQCYHCGERCGNEAVKSNDKSFCCLGCKTVFELLSENGLCSYYDFETQPGISFKNAGNPLFDYLDDASISKQLIQFQDGTLAKATFSLPQIHCVSCVWLLENMFKINPAILRSEVNFLAKEISISFRIAEISIRQIVELLAKLGYEPDIRLETNTSKAGKKRSALLQSLYLKIGVAGFAFGNVMLFSFPDYLDSTGDLSRNFSHVFSGLSIALAIPVLLFSASDYFRASWYSFKQRQISLDIPIAIGLTALFVRSIFDIVSGTGTGYLDSFTGLVFFLLTGKIFQQKTFDTLKFDRDYASYFPLSVTVKQGTAERSKAVTQLVVGDRLFIRNKELIPSDSILLSSTARIDYSFVTGESIPVELTQGAQIYAGGRIVGSGAEMTVIKPCSQSYLTELWNNDSFKKEKRTSFTDVSDVFGKYFTIIVAIIATAALCYWFPFSVSTAVTSFTAVLIVACPCALTLAAPFTLGAAVAMFGKAKLYIKNIGVVVDVANIDTIVFDKTGTLTQSKISKVQYNGTPISTTVTSGLYKALQNSSHPLASAVRNYIFTSGTVVTSKLIENFVEIPGKGLQFELDGEVVRVGSATFMQSVVPSTSLQETIGSSAVHVAVNSQYYGVFNVSSLYRNGIETLLPSLQQKCKVFIISGDNDAEKDTLAALVPATNMFFNQSPQEKLDLIKRLQSEGNHVAMIGDGLNDAGALQQANVGIALAEDAASFTPASDAIMDSSILHRLPEFIHWSKFAVRTLQWAFALSIVYNAIGLYWAVTGTLTPLVAAIFMPLSSWSVVLFSWGVMKSRERKITVPSMFQLKERAF